MVRIVELFVFFLPLCIALPEDIDESMYCAGCIATMKELYLMLENLHHSDDPFEMHVINAMDEVCHRDHFKAYDYIPPKMVKACQLLLDEFDEDIEIFLKTHPRIENMEKKFCYEISKACVGVDREKKPDAIPKTITTHFDGDRQELPVDERGRVKLGPNAPDDFDDEEEPEVAKEPKKEKKKAKKKAKKEKSKDEL
ncbi:uncharacterized protein LOC144435777 [Glandiceps talaboti]